MGYTHYASRRNMLPYRTFKIAAADCRKVVETLCQEKGFTVQWDLDDPRPPEFDHNGVRFNGVGEQGHETFCIRRVYQPYPEHQKPARGEGWFEFTKTARKPYDAAVCACLIVFDHHFGKSYLVSSDGDDTDDGWVAARECCQRVLGYGADFTLNVPPKMTRHGLAYSSGWYNTSGDGQVRTLSNGWELRKSRSAAFKYTVYNRNPRHGADSFITSGNTIRETLWQATVAYFQTEFQDAPHLDEFASAMRVMPGEWSTFLVWSDKVQDNGQEVIAQRIRAHVPR